MSVPEWFSKRIRHIYGFDLSYCHVRSSINLMGEEQHVRAKICIFRKNLLKARTVAFLKMEKTLWRGVCNEKPDLIESDIQRQDFDIPEGVTEWSKDDREKS